MTCEGVAGLELESCCNTVSPSSQPQQHSTANTHGSFTAWADIPLPPAPQHSPLASLETEQTQSFITTATRRCVCVRLFSLWTACTDTCGLEQHTQGREAHFTHPDGWKQQAAKKYPQLKQEVSQFLIPRLPTQCGFWSNPELYWQSLPCVGTGHLIWT